MPVVSFVLLPSLRYVHSASYVEGLAAEKGFAVERVVEAPLRNDQGRPVIGLYVYLRALPADCESQGPA